MDFLAIHVFFQHSDEHSCHLLFQSSSQMFGSSTSVCSVDALESGSVKAKKRSKNKFFVLL